MRIKIKKIVAYVFLSSLCLFANKVNAEYTPAIVCPNDGKEYVVVVKNSDPETEGPKKFDPKSGSEFCVEGKMGQNVTYEKIKAAKIYTLIDEGAQVTVEHVECDTAYAGGSDKYDWDDGLQWKLGTNDSFSLGREPGLPTPCPSNTPGSQNERRMRYALKGTYLYVIGPGKTTGTGTGTSGSDALKAHCGTISTKDACNADTNCEWGGANFCYPKGGIPGQATASTPLSPPDMNEYLNNKYSAPANSNFLPDCAYTGTCDDINDLLALLINVAKFLFKIIGTTAFAFFVYGGFTMVLSMGNADKVKSGRETLVAAVIGLIIAFSAYVLVDVVLDILHVSNDYRNVGSLDIKK